MKAVKKDSQETNTYNPSTEKSAGISAQRWVKQLSVTRLAIDKNICR